MSVSFHQQRDMNSYLESFSNSISIMCPYFTHRGYFQRWKMSLEIQTIALNKTTGQIG